MYLRVNLLGPGPLLTKKRIYRAAVSQRLRNTALWDPISFTIKVKTTEHQIVQLKKNLNEFTSNYVTYSTKSL